MFSSFQNNFTTISTGILFSMFVFNFMLLAGFSFLKNYFNLFSYFLDVSSFVAYLHIAHVKQARWYVFSLALLTISVGDIPSKHPPHRGPYSLDKTSLKGVSTNFECRLIIYSYSGRRSLQAIKEKLFKLTASLDFYVYVYPCCLTA